MWSGNDARDRLTKTGQRRGKREERRESHWIPHIVISLSWTGGSSEKNVGVQGKGIMIVEMRKLSF